MERRTFLRTLALAAAGVTFDPERLLWVPGQKTIFIPSAPIRCRLTIGDIVAVTYDKIIRERRRDIWSDSVLWERLSSSSMIRPALVGVVTNVQP